MKAPTRGRGSRHLDPDDAVLWDHAAQSVAPLKGRKGRHHPAAERGAAAPAGKVAPGLEKSKAQGKAVTPRADPPPLRPASGKAPSAVATGADVRPPLATFDRKHARKIRSGQVAIDARIDLHGMRQDEAHAALIRFLHRCQSKGQRSVLVITGKGKAVSRDAAPFTMGEPRERGVLRRNVPRWLDDVQLRPLVVSYTTAAMAHGGEGALYVYLRKLR